MNITISIGWITLTAFAAGVSAGAVVVKLLWWRSRQRKVGVLVELRLAVHNLICDSRRNALVEGVARKAEGGNLHARKDFELLDALVMSALKVYGAGDGPRRVWADFQSRVLWSPREPDRAEEV